MRATNIVVESFAFSEHSGYPLRKYNNTNIAVKSK